MVSPAPGALPRPESRQIDEDARRRPRVGFRGLLFDGARRNEQRPPQEGGRWDRRCYLRRCLAHIIPAITEHSNNFRTTVYIDGFNLYFGIRDKGWNDCKWLDLEALSRSIVPAQNHANLTVKYFTAHIASPPSKARRQAKYLEALEAHTTIEIVKGAYQDTEIICRRCESTWTKGEEKMTDVAIATAIIDDAYQNRVDSILIVSGDRDVVPAVNLVQLRFPHIEVGVAFPPNRVSTHLKEVVKGRVTYINRRKLLSSQLPQEVVKSDGVILGRPGVW